jgi:hypothetical protein
MAWQTEKWYIQKQIKRDGNGKDRKGYEQVGVVDAKTQGQGPDDDSQPQNPLSLYLSFPLQKGPWESLRRWP